MHSWIFVLGRMHPQLPSWSLNSRQVRRGQAHWEDLHRVVVSHFCWAARRSRQEHNSASQHLLGSWFPECTGSLNLTPFSHLTVLLALPDFF